MSPVPALIGFLLSTDLDLLSDPQHHLCRPLNGRDVRRDAKAKEKGGSIHQRNFSRGNQRYLAKTV